MVDVEERLSPAQVRKFMYNRRLSIRISDVKARYAVSWLRNRLAYNHENRVGQQSIVYGVSSLNVPSPRFSYTTLVHVNGGDNECFLHGRSAESIPYPPDPPRSKLIRYRISRPHNHQESDQRPQSVDEDSTT